MLKLLLKKQLTEVFRSYFYNAKKNKKRSTVGVVLYFVLFFFLMAGILGGMFTFMATSLCGPLASVGMGWLYFIIFTGLSLVLGAFGSVFNTFSGLYMAKDNDLLLSMPIPVSCIIASRLLNVYLLGTMYSIVVILPALIVYWVVFDASFAAIFCGILLAITITLIVLILSCLLGRVVAAISRKLKNKSFITVLISLLGIGLYYFLYYRASDVIQDIIKNAEQYGESLKGSAYGLYLFGGIGEGNYSAAFIALAASLLLMGGTWLLLKKSFVSIAASTNTIARRRVRNKALKQSDLFTALFKKELSLLTAKPAYMLNCALGVLLIPAMGVLLLVKGGDLFALFDALLTEKPGSVCVLLSLCVCLMSSMIDTAAPSVSLEGKSLWILRSLPVRPVLVLRAKAALQLVLSAVPMLFTGVCAALIYRGSLLQSLLMCLVPLSFALLMSVFGVFIGLKIPNLNWTSELVPIKQGGAVTIALFGGWLYTAALGCLFMLVDLGISADMYLVLVLLLDLVLSSVICVWLEKEGSRVFSTL